MKHGRVLTFSAEDVNGAAQRKYKKLYKKFWILRKVYYLCIRND